MSTEMKQLELELKKRLLIVEVKENDLEDFSKRKYYFSYEGKNPIKLICKGSELTEEIAKGFLLKTSDEFYADYSKYHDGRGFFMRFKSPLESLISAIVAQGYYWGGNPYNIYELSTWHNVSKEWQEAESKTFNPDKTLIFEIL